MKKYLIMIFVLISSISFSQTEVCFRSFNQDKSVVIVQSNELSSVLTGMGNFSNKDNSTKVGVVIGYVLLNSFVITEYCIRNQKWKESNPNYWSNIQNQNQSPGFGYPPLKKPNSLGMVSTLILSTGLVVTVLIAF